MWTDSRAGLEGDLKPAPLREPAYYLSISSVKNGGGSCTGQPCDTYTFKFGSPERNTSHATLYPVPSYFLPILPLLKGSKPFYS